MITRILFITTFLLAILALKLGPIDFGKSTKIYHLSETKIENGKKTTFNLGVKAVKFSIGLGAYAKPEGYVLYNKANIGLRQEEGWRYIPIQQDQVEAMKRLGQIPQDAPLAKLPTGQYFLGYSLWIIGGLLLIAISMHHNLLGRISEWKERRHAYSR